MCRYSHFIYGTELFPRIIQALTTFYRTGESVSIPSAERATYVIANPKTIGFAYYASVHTSENFYFTTWMEKS